MSGTGIVIAGVGGQGTLLASRIIGSAAIKQGYDVKVSEVHGMSQRGGSVITFVRFDRAQVNSPIVDHGCADVVLAFETLEAYRSLPYLKKNALLIVNTQTIAPMPVIMGAAVLPTGIVDKVKQYDIRVEAIDANALALSAGSDRSVNVSLIGRMAACMAGHLDISKDVWLETLRETVKPSFLEINLRAFEMGYTATGGIVS